MSSLVIDEYFLEHYGIPRRSGRYPWGSGTEDTDHNNRIFIQSVEDLRRQGLTDKEIYTGFGMKSGEFRATLSNAKAQRKQADIIMAERLRDKGMSPTEIGRRMNIPEPTIRTMLAPGAADKANKTENTAKVIKRRVDESKYIDVGRGTETQIGVTSTTMNNAVSSLRAQGYELHQVKILQPGTGHETNFKILTPPGTPWPELANNKDKIQQINNFTEDSGRTFYGIHPPIQINPKRVSVLYKEDGGGTSDGVIYVRPGVKDIELGGNNYAQVRVAVGKGHYLKGMAIYKDDLPDGIDLVFNTAKSDTGKKLDAFKEIGDDPDNPFGTIIDRQIVANAGKSNEKVTSAMNIVNEEGKWATWNKTVSSQLLSKQKPELAKSQLAMTYERRENEFKELNTLTNDTVRKRLLMDFADGTDAASVHLKAASFPGQATHVILPLKTINPNQVYAPGYNNGDRVVLVRFPHGGPFEIPDLVVNNRNAEARKSIGTLTKDAIGIHHTVAERLSGADFDGDTVLVIPDRDKRITVKPALAELKDFDPRTTYRGYEGMKVMKNTQTEMGKISNLITDMSLQGAPNSDLARAVKHSMVVIDAEKHKLNHRASANDNNIAQLKKKYQQGGASTIISRKKAEDRVPRRKPRSARLGGPIDKKTGEKVYELDPKVNYRTGKPLTTKVEKLAEVKDAHLLSSGTPIERYYADHSNKLKSLANEARRVSVNTPNPKQNTSAKKTYAKEIKSLNDQLAIAIANKPKERQALVISNAQYRLKLDAKPHMEEEEKKKIRFQTLEEARRRTGSSKTKIKVTDKEWEAIQSGAISHSKLGDILDNADMDIVRDHATPKTKTLMTSAKTARAQQMLASGYTRAEVASQLGVSLSTLDSATG